MQIDLIKLAGGTKARAKDVNDNNDILKSAIYQLEEQLNSFGTYIEDLKRKPTRAAFEIYYYYSTKAPTGAFPLWTGEWVNHCKSLYPDFWNELVKRKEAGQVRAIDNEAYEQEVTNKGQCGAFVVDELNGHVRLPKITRFISSLENEIDIGTTQDAAMQKHKHNFIASTNGAAHGATGNSFVASTTFASGSPRGLWTSPGNVTNTVAITESDGEEKGYPQNVRLGLYIQVANNVAEISQMDPEVIAKELTEAVDEINTVKVNALGEMDALKDSSLEQMDTALQEALDQLNASDVLSGIETALNQINGGY